MAITLDKKQENGGTKEIKVDGERESGMEVRVRHENARPKWKKWNYESFSRVWNKNYSV